MIGVQQQLEAIRGGDPTTVFAGIGQWGASCPVVWDYFCAKWQLEGLLFSDFRRAEAVVRGWGGHLDQWAAAYHAAVLREQRPSESPLLNKAWRLYLEHTFPVRNKGGAASERRYKSAVFAGLGLMGGRNHINTGFYWDTSDGTSIILSIERFNPTKPFFHVYEDKSPHTQHIPIGERYCKGPFDRVPSNDESLRFCNSAAGGFCSEALLAWAREGRRVKDSLLEKVVTAAEKDKRKHPWVSEQKHNQWREDLSLQGKVWL